LSLRDWAILVHAAGIDVRQLDPMTVYLIAGKIIQDRELTVVALSLYGEGSQLPKGARAKVLQSWPSSERLAFRDRVLGVVTFHGR
jgi:hypothetical protein